MYAFFHELWQVGIYKRTQGRITRQVTFAAIALVWFLGIVRLTQAVLSLTSAVKYSAGGVLLVAGIWVAYRLVNLPVFADFLIAVEAEMKKVSWPARAELIRASIVVLITIFALAMVLFFFDIAWEWLFRWLGVLPSVD